MPTLVREAVVLLDDYTPLPAPRPERCAYTIPLLPDLGELVVLRAWLDVIALHLGMPRDEMWKVKQAVNKLARNAIRHGCPPIAVLVWSEDGALVAEVADMGFWQPPPDLARCPADVGSGQFGLWAVRQISDRMLIRTGHEGTRVRLAWEGTQTRPKGPRAATMTPGRGVDQRRYLF